MKLFVRVNEMDFKMPIGAGNQTVGWLGLAVAQRYALFKPTKPARATRMQPSSEEGQARRGFLLPKAIVNETKGVEITNASDILNDIFNDGDRVIVHLQTELPIDSDGGPAMSELSEKAFCHSEAFAMRCKLRAEMQACDKEEEARRAAASGTSSKAVPLMAGELETEEDVQVAFDMDWSSMGTEKFGGSRSEQEPLRAMLVSHFRMLNSLFTLYCGEPNPGHPYGMDFSSWVHVAHFAKLAHATKDAQTLREVFDDCAAKRKPLMTRARFIRAVVSTSMKLHCGGRLAVEKVDQCFQETLQEYWSKFEKDAAAKALRTTIGRSTYRSTETFLRAVFDAFCETNKNELTPEEFKKACEQGGILSIILTDENANQRVFKMCLQARFGAQGDPDHDSELEGMVFGEFVVALARVALDALGTGEDDIPEELVRLGFDQVAQYSIQLR